MSAITTSRLMTWRTPVVILLCGALVSALGFGPRSTLGLFLTLNEPTREMEKEAASAGLYETGGMKVPKLQILTAAQIQLAKNGCFRASERQGTRDGWIV